MFTPMDRVVPALCRLLFVYNPSPTPDVHHRAHSSAVGWLVFMLHRSTGEEVRGVVGHYRPSVGVYVLWRSNVLCLLLGVHLQQQRLG